MDARVEKQKFLGSILGVALGDALGASHEGRRMASDQETEHLGRVVHPLIYTDDTHMTIGIAESLTECGGVDGEHMTRRFMDNFSQEPWRGYGPGPPRVFRLIAGGEYWDKAAADIYPGGSFGNGAAMRVAPVGLFFSHEPAELRRAVYVSSIITHCHPLGIEGASLQAKAVSLAVAEDPDRALDVSHFVTQLRDFTTEEIYRAKIDSFGALLERVDDRRGVVGQLGHGIEAFNSVPTAIFSFLAQHKDFASTVIYAVSLGGDTDTIAAMAGAISGAYLGVDALPPEWLDKLENREQLSDLAERLWRVSSGAG